MGNGVDLPTAVATAPQHGVLGLMRHPESGILRFLEGLSARQNHIQTWTLVVWKIF